MVHFERAVYEPSMLDAGTLSGTMCVMWTVSKLVMRVYKFPILLITTITYKSFTYMEFSYVVQGKLSYT